MAGTGGLSALQISHTAKFLVIEEIKNAPDSPEVGCFVFFLLFFFHVTMYTASCFGCSSIPTTMLVLFTLWGSKYCCLMVYFCYEPMNWFSITDQGSWNIDKETTLKPQHISFECPTGRIGIC